ncbi:MAG: acetylglutamate kinase [Phycisphaerales bacterium]
MTDDAAIAATEDADPVQADRIRPVVVKVGGRHVADDEGAAALAAFALEQQTNAGGRPLVIVHGGGDETQALHDALGVACHKVDGLRVTSDASMPLVTMTLRGVVNTRLVAALHRRGVRAMGVSGVDMGVMQAERLDADRFGRVGGTPTVDADTLRFLLSRSSVLVVAPVCLGDDGHPVNVNADTAAEAVAAALGASSLDFVTDVPGVLDDGEVVRRIEPARCIRLVERGVIRGGMLPKSEAARRALREGVGRVRIGTMSSLAREEATEFVAATSHRIARVRGAQEREAGAISALLDHCAPRCVRRSKEEVLRAIDEHIVAIDDAGRIIGSVQLRETADAVEIRGLAVDAGARGLGVGAALMERARERQERRACDLTCVTCEPSFFERFGFSIEADADAPPRPDDADLTAIDGERVCMRRPWLELIEAA